MSQPTHEELLAQLAAAQKQVAQLQKQLADQPPAPPTVKAESSGIAVAKDVKGSTLISGDENVTAGGHVIFAETGATVVIGDAPVAMNPEMRNTALGRYLHHLISRNRYLQLQGIRSGGKLVHIELDRIYIRLRATQQRLVKAEERWLSEEAGLAPGELHRMQGRGAQTLLRMTTETVTVAVEEARYRPTTVW
ncbi:MAG: hypothetical protein U0175_26630 [Caldilineaceae bacterium]